MAKGEKKRVRKVPRQVRHIMANGDILYNDEIAHYVINPNSFPPAAAHIIRELVKETPEEREARLAKEKAGKVADTA